MNARRILGALVAFAFAFMTMPVQPARSAGETLGLIILDPTEINGVTNLPYSRGSTGTAPFPGPGPATDPGPNDHTVRTNDTVTYDMNYNLLGGNGTNVVITADLPAGVAQWNAPSPADCPGGYTITTVGPNTQLQCNIGAPIGGVYDFLPSAKMLATTTANGTQVTVSASISDTGSTTVTETGYENHLGQPAAQIYDTIVGAQTAQLLKQTNAVSPSYTHTFNGEGAVPGYYVTYPVLIREGNGVGGSTGGSQFGNLPLASSIPFTDTVTTSVPGVVPASNACGPNGSGITIPGDPYGTSTGHPSAQSVTDSGSFTCTASGPTTFLITITNADTSGTHYPTNNANNSQVENATYVVSGYFRVFIPDASVPAGGLPLADVYQGFGSQSPSNGTCTTGDPGLQLCASTTLPQFVPGSYGGGASSKIFRADTNETPITPTNANGPALTGGEQIVSVINVTNQQPTGSQVDVENGVMCDTIDTSHANVYPFDGSTDPGGPMNTGAAAILGTGNSVTTVTAIEFGTAAANCNDADPSANWSTTVSTNSANTFYYGNITKVRVLFTDMAPQQTLKLYLNEKVLPAAVPAGSAGTPGVSVGPGDIVRNQQTTTGTVYYLGAPTASTFSSFAQTTGQIFNVNYSILKGLLADVSNNALFSVLGFASGANPPGSVINPSQEFVGYLEVNGSQGTVTQPNVYICDVIDTTKYNVKDFDGTTNPSTPITGPVGFRTGGFGSGNGGFNNGLNFSAPAGAVISYSTDAPSGGENCQNGTWSTTEPPAASITKVRALIPNLGVNQSVLMFVNFVANSALVPGTPAAPNAVTNSMYSSTGASPGTTMTSSRTVDVASEVVTLGKSVTPSSVNAGATATYTLTPTLYGVGSASSGLVTITDTLPTGLAYHNASGQFINLPGGGSTWVPSSGNATPTITTNGMGQQVLTFTVGTSTAAPGRYVSLPQIQFQADVSISDSGSVTNNAVINDALDTSGTNHNASASITVTVGSSFITQKAVVTPVSSLVPNGPIQYELRYVNTGAQVIAWTDFIDILPYNGDAFGSNFHGTSTFVSATGSYGEQIEYTNKPPTQIDLDPICSSNGGTHGSIQTPPAGGCTQTAVTTWCPVLGGPGCPATAAQVTAIRVLGNTALPAAPPTVQHNIEVMTQTSGNVFSDVYGNGFDARISTNALLAQSSTSATIPIPPTPFVTLVKSCLAPPTCTTAPQAPGTDITYGIAAKNTGGHAAAQFAITDPIPANTDYKVGSASSSVPSAISFSTDGVNYTYTPVSGGGGAAANYDRNVVSVRWTLTAQLGTVAPGNAATVQFTAAIR